MTKEQILQLFSDTGVLKEGHFLLTSGRHSDKYLQCAQLLQHPKATQKASTELAKNFQDKDIQTVISPAVGGIIVSYEMARALDARAIFAEREDGKMTLRRGFALQPGERVLVVEDVVTTGGSVREVIDLVREEGAQVVGVGVLVNRSGKKMDFGVPSYSLLEMEVDTFSPEECPLCKKGSKPVKPGSRKV